MLNVKNKQQIVRRNLAREILVLHLNNEDRILPIKHYATQFEVGIGTVQGALNDLKSAGVIQLTACGAQGTFIERVDKDALWEMCEYGEIIGVLPLDTSLCIKGLATGIYEAFTLFNLPIHILFTRGAGNRIDIMLRGKCDFVVLSEMACDYAVGEMRRNVRKVTDIGVYPHDHGCIVRKGEPFDIRTAKIAYDNFSYDQKRLISYIKKEEDACGDYLSVQLMDLVRDGSVEAAMVDRNVAKNAQELDFFQLQDLTEDVKSKISKAVVGVDSEDIYLASLLRTVFAEKFVAKCQDDVFKGKRFVKY